MSTANVYAELNKGHGDVPSATPVKVLNAFDATYGKVCLLAYGTAVPSAETGYAIGCIFIQTDGSGETVFYVNTGSTASCTFTANEQGLEAALALTTNGNGASKVGIEDSAGLITATTVEAALAEIVGRLNGAGTIGTGPSPLVWAGTDVVNLMTDIGSGFIYQNDFLQGPLADTDDTLFVQTDVNSGDILLDATAAGGVIVFDSAGFNAANDGVEGQLTSCMVLPAAGKTIKFEARVKMVNTGIDQYYIGLAGVDTTLLASGAVDDVIDKAGFYRLHASTADKMSTINSRTSEQEIGADLATPLTDNTYYNFGIVIDGITSVKYYLNGVLVDTASTANAIPNAVMCPTFAAKVGQTSTDAELRVDWVRVTQEAR